MKVKPWIVKIAALLILVLWTGSATASERNGKPPESFQMAQTLFNKEKKPEFEARIQNCTGRKLSAKAKDCRFKMGKMKYECRAELKIMRDRCRAKALTRWKRVEMKDELEEEAEEESIYAVPPPSANHR